MQFKSDVPESIAWIVRTRKELILKQDTRQGLIREKQKDVSVSKWSDCPICLNETYSTVRIGKHLSGTFPIQRDLMQGNNFCHFV